MSRGIAILGWGSLVWELETLAPHVAGGWMPRQGPSLPIEFSRVSVKRRMGLTLVLDPENGTCCATHVIRARRSRLAEAVTDLAARERAPERWIGWAEPSGRGHARLPEVLRHVAEWCAQEGWEGAVWTDLEPNFAAMTGKPFSVDAAIAHLRELPEASLAEAYRYIRRAPPTSRTPLRRALARHPWWRALRRARGGAGMAAPPADAEPAREASWPRRAGLATTRQA